MNVATSARTLPDIRCYYRPIILAAIGAVILSVFWFASRYPQLLHKAQVVGRAVPSMAYGSELIVLPRTPRYGGESSPARSTGSTA